MSEASPASPPGETLAIIVVNYGLHALVERNVLHTVGSQFAGRVVIVDNFRSTAEQQAMADVCARHGWQLVASDSNRGFGGGVNLGARHAASLGARELLVLNPDAWMAPEPLRALHTTVAANPLQLVAPTVLRPDGRMYSAAVDLHLDTGEMRATRKRPAGVEPTAVMTWVSGACFMISTRLFDLIGGFDEDYFLYWEDVDLSRKVALAGGSVRVLDDLVAEHDEGQSHGSDRTERAKSPLYYYYNTRNRLMYAAKHLGEVEQRRWVRATPQVSYRILLQGGRRQLVNPRATLWPAARGSWHGYRYLRRARAGPPSS